MTKRKLSALYYFCKEVVFILLLCLPLISYVIFNIHNEIDFLTYINTNFINLSNLSIYGIFTSVLNNIFSSSLTSNIFSWFMTYYLIIELIHIVFDVLLFVPRIGEKLIRRVIGE